jgi:hypothetical protein
MAVDSYLTPGSISGGEVCLDRPTSNAPNRSTGLFMGDLVTLVQDIKHRLDRTWRDSPSGSMFFPSLNINVFSYAELFWHLLVNRPKPT